MKAARAFLAFVIALLVLFAVAALWHLLLGGPMVPPAGLGRVAEEAR